MEESDANNMDDEQRLVDGDEASPVTLRQRRFDEKSAKTDRSSPEQQQDQQKDIASKARKKKRKDENLFCSRFITFLMISPTIIYFFSVLYDIISRYSFSGKVYHIGAMILGFAIAGALSIFVFKPLKPYLKYIAFASISVLFIPTIQVYNCSPIPLNNSDIGTLVRLNEEADGFLKIVYQGSECWKNQHFKTPVEFSLYSPKVKVILKPYQIINLGMQHFPQQDEGNEEGPPPEVLPYTLYLLMSQRSVKKRIYYINLLTMVAGKTRGIAEVLDLSVDDRENITIHITGSLKKLDANFIQTKKEIESMEYLVRPIVFHVYEVEVIGMPEKKDDEDEKYRRGGRNEKGRKSKQNDNADDEKKGKPH